MSRKSVLVTIPLLKGEINRKPRSKVRETTLSKRCSKSRKVRDQNKSQRKYKMVMEQMEFR